MHGMSAEELRFTLIPWVQCTQSLHECPDVWHQSFLECFRFSTCALVRLQAEHWLASIVSTSSGIFVYAYLLDCGCVCGHCCLYSCYTCHHEHGAPGWSTRHARGCHPCWTGACPDLSGGAAGPGPAACHDHCPCKGGDNLVSSSGSKEGTASGPGPEHLGSPCSQKQAGHLKTPYCLLGHPQ